MVPHQLRGLKIYFDSGCFQSWTISPSLWLQIQFKLVTLSPWCGSQTRDARVLNQMLHRQNFIKWFRARCTAYLSPHHQAQYPSFTLPSFLDLSPTHRVSLAAMEKTPVAVSHAPVSYHLFINLFMMSKAKPMYQCIARPVQAQSQRWAISL